MNEDPRCCGNGVCIINADGECWCGQKWDGSKMTSPRHDQPTAELPAIAEAGKVAKPRPLKGKR